MTSPQDLDWGDHLLGRDPDPGEVMDAAREQLGLPVGRVRRRAPHGGLPDTRR